MALGNLLLLLLVLAIVCADRNEVESKDKAEKAVETKTDQRPRSAMPDPVRGSFDKLNRMLNRTEDRKNRRRKVDFTKIYTELHRTKTQNDDIQNDNNNNDVAIATNQKTMGNDNETSSLTTKMKELRPDGPNYEAHENTDVPHVTGVYCDFEPHNASDSCMWQWNTTLSDHGLGFKIMTAAEVTRMNETIGMKFSGPPVDADEKRNGHFLYLPVDPTMENMVVKSPPFRGLWEFCKFEARLHQSKMQNASIRLVSESTVSGVQWILQEVSGNNVERWLPMRFMIGKVQQEVRIIVEITRPNYVNLSQTLPHIAIDNIRMVECLPEPPVFNGECQNGQLKCNIMKKESCIKLQQICDLVKDCDDSTDEQKQCDKMPYGSYCNFEQDSCGFENVPQPILKWSRHSGPTPTDKTGPNFDHTCGPPRVYTTENPMVPLSPAHMNHTLACMGYYFFVNMNVTGPNQERADFASTAVMKTTIFNPPPKVHGDINSKYYNCCMVRFYYQQNGRNYGSLSLDVVELTSRGNITTSLWFSTKDKGENWYRAAIFLPNITTRYYFLFKTRMGMRIYSDSAIDDFSMAPECFGLNIDPAELGEYNYYDPIFEEKTTPHEDFADAMVYRFTPCGAVGRIGPNQTMCDTFYRDTPASVSVIQSPPYQGIQIWEVPSEGLYTIIATGASGGLGSMWAGVSHGAQARGLFELHRGEKLYMLLGQQGLNACKKTLSAQESQECAHRHNTTTQVYTSKTHEIRNTHVNDGGGGGGGGTYVFLVDNDGNSVPLVVGGGGGGLSVGIFRDDGSQHGRGRTNATPESGYMYGEIGRTSGAGGGWNDRVGPTTPGFEEVRGSALRAGGKGGRACWGGAHGGFGGGGGGCVRGGAGGGWLGGNSNEGEGYHGSGGWSYVDVTRGIPEFADVGIAARNGPGEVLVIPALHKCGCSYRCVALNEYRSEVRCYCPAAWTADDKDPKKCILEDKFPSLRLVVIMMSALLVFVVVLVLCFFLYLYNRYQKKKEAEQHQKRLLQQEDVLQLHRLRNAPGGDNPLGMAFNPHYGSEGFLPQGFDVRGLPRVEREKLKLINTSRPLGQGAFGEVYQGLYKHRPGEEMPVAVKTLPELSTGQAESDFLMEAAIMAKFNHPNIVHLIGVCFERHPRYIVLELLAGGDLKKFLRESRPKPERASALTMKDLILCSMDIAKGCRYLESKRFIHRDIAARNCLLTSRGPGRVVKIADFGMARDIYRSDYYKKGGKAMLPIKWMPPEAYIDGVFTCKTDIWSYGVLLWEVFSMGVMPYTGCANREVMELVSGGGRLDKPFVGCPNEVYRLMCDCWNPSPDERPNFSMVYDRLQGFLQDPQILEASLPIVRSFIGGSRNETPNDSVEAQRSSAGDYLVPKSAQDPAPDDSPTDQPDPHSKSQAAAPGKEVEDSRFPLLLKASQDYGNIPMASRRGPGEDCSAASAAVRTAKFLPSKSTDRLICSVEGPSMDDDIATSVDDKPVIRETSFIEKPKTPAVEKHKTPSMEKHKTPSVEKPKTPSVEKHKTPSVEKHKTPSMEKHKTPSVEKHKTPSVEKHKTPSVEKPKTPSVEAKRKNSAGPVVEKLISITPTSPKPPENALSEPVVIDKTNKTSLAPERKAAPIASPDPPRINAWNKEVKTPKSKPFCLDAAQLEENLNELKKNSGSVNLTTMNAKILPPYINVVTPNKLSESKTIQIDPKKAVIHDLPKEEVKEEKNKLKQSNSAASLLNGPLTDVPYADSDNTSSSSGGQPNGKNGNRNGNGNGANRNGNGRNNTGSGGNGKRNHRYEEITIETGKFKKQGSGVGDSEISC
ncbi:ALK tyrosine kinase receptor isoform X2 [Aricia agestis]|uniref:ALK tyrosine kinase receptor isoform X2 n=1 Tax=Aricia agestis TaxID=91739 RepID=UPI001C20A919|nr:ALK tyrosine kinase receptor isoform X2 [Aricia agestis]